MFQMLVTVEKHQRCKSFIREGKLKEVDNNGQILTK